MDNSPKNPIAGGGTAILKDRTIPCESCVCGEELLDLMYARSHLRSSFLARSLAIVSSALVRDGTLSLPLLRSSVQISQKRTLSGNCSDIANVLDLGS